MTNLRVMSVAISLGAGAVFTSFRDPWHAAPVLLVPASVTERYDELPPLLLPESAAPMLSTRAGPGERSDAVFRFVVDTLGRVDSSTIETLVATDSAAARNSRRGLSDVRYLPARLVLDVGHCVRFNGTRAHCGGPTPTIKRVRARVVLHLETFRATEP